MTRQSEKMRDRWFSAGDAAAVLSPGRRLGSSVIRSSSPVGRRSVWSFLERAYGLDLRSLALFRICLGALIVGDLIWRVRDLRAFYTDFGVLPRAVLLDQFAGRWVISVHLMSGEALVQAVLFLVAMGFSVMLLVGYRTKLATIASWVLLISLQNRNPFVLDSGDVLLRMLVFWGMFLPLNAHFSVDRALDESNGEHPPHVVTGGSLALIAQVVLMYWFAVMWKSGPEWRTEGSAVYYTLSLEQFATPVGRYLLQFPSVLTFLTFLTMAIEAWAPVFLLCPFLTGPVRTASIFLMLMLQVGLLICMHLGRFPLVAMAAVIGLIPTGFWSRAAKRGGGWNGEEITAHPLRIYFDGGCEFCRKMVLILATFLLPRGAAILRAQDDPQMLAELPRENSWIVVDHNGKHYFRSSALAAILRRSIWAPLAWILDRGPVRTVADRGYDWVAGHRSLLARLVSPLRYRPVELRTHWLASVVAAFFLGYVFWWNLGTLSARLAMPDRYRWIGVATGTDQSWGMFAPSPLRDDGWYVIPGVLQNGRHVDVSRNGAPVSFAKLDSSAIAGQYRDERWRNYFLRLYLPIGVDRRLHYARYLCRRWNEGRTANDPELLKTFDIYFMMRTNVLLTQSPKAHEKHLLHRQRCG